jgi:F0F1-type ATP synthase membrane subunit c/vacuolar-type H+-ATPase subunit K
VKVFIDGKLATERLSGFALEIDPGLHKFRFESPPWPVIEREVLASEGVKDRPIDVEFAPPLPTAAQLAAAPEPPRPFRLERSDYVFGGIALAGIATLAYFGGTGIYDANQLESSCMSFCKNDEVNPVRTKLIIADIGMGVAILSLVIGMYLHGRGVF